MINPTTDESTNSLKTQLAKMKKIKNLDNPEMFFTISTGNFPSLFKR